MVHAGADRSHGRGRRGASPGGGGEGDLIAGDMAGTASGANAPERRDGPRRIGDRDIGQAGAETGGDRDGRADVPAPDVATRPMWLRSSAWTSGAGIGDLQCR